jgi:transposase
VAKAYVEGAYRRAVFRHRPGFRDAAEALAEIGQIRARVSSLGWNARCGPTDHAILLAHLNIAERRKSLSYGASVREIAEGAGLSSIGTVSRSHRRLRNGGWLVANERSGRSKSSQWTIWQKRTKKNIRISLRGCEEECSSLCAFPGEDIWRRKGLGKRAFHIWSLIDGQSTRSMANELGLSVRTVQVHIQKLKGYGLIRIDAARDGSATGGKPADGSSRKWRRCNRDYGAVALELGVAGEGDRQHECHLDERAIYNGDSRGAASN